MFFQHLVPTGLRGQFTTWLMGSIPEYVSSWRLVFSASLAVVAMLYAMSRTRTLDLCLLSDDEATSLGVALGPLRIGIFLACGVLTSLSVSLAGPIAFVGLVGPHAARLRSRISSWSSPGRLGSLMKLCSFLRAFSRATPLKYNS